MAGRRVSRPLKNVLFLIHYVALSRLIFFLKKGRVLGIRTPTVQPSVNYSSVCFCLSGWP